MKTIVTIRPLTLALLAATSVFWQAGSWAKEAVLSEKPIEIRLPVGKEFIIKFPQAITHTNLLNQDSSDKLDTMITPQGVLYMTPAESFEKSRMVAELVDGRLVMLDVEASELGPFDSTLTIVEAPPEPTPQLLPQPVETTAGQPEMQPGQDGKNPARNPYKPDFLVDDAVKTLDVAGDGRSSTPRFHDMVRYGFRHYVGPSRLIGDKMGKSVKVGKGEIGDRLIRMNAGKLKIKALRQWEIDGHYLTVLLVNNTSRQSVAFDPRALRGRFKFAAALYPVLEPSGSRFDQTLWAVITAVPFDKSGR